MSKWSDAFNALPMDVRHVGAMCECEMRINQLILEKDRLEKRYSQSLIEINDHIANLKKWMLENETGG